MNKKAFLAFPFKEEYSDIIATIEEVVLGLGLETINPEKEAYAGSISGFIRSSIENSSARLAVLNEENGNVYYEIGLAHCRRIPVVLLTEDPDSLKFDLRDQRAIVYDRSNPTAIKDELCKVLKRALEPKNEEEFISSAFHGSKSTEPKDSYKLILQQIQQLHHLNDPYIKSLSLSQDKQYLNVVVADFIGNNVRSRFDINGLLIEAVRSNAA